jgi:hypothetical protein
VVYEVAPDFRHMVLNCPQPFVYRYPVRVNWERRPPLVTAVAVIGILAGTVGAVELTMLMVSAPFATWFLEKIIQVGGAMRG